MTLASSQLKRVTPPLPALIGVLGIAAGLVIVVPVIALGIRVPWGRLGEILARPATTDMLLLSLASAAQATIFAVVLGTGLALWLNRLGKGAFLVRLLVYLPLALPPVVAGLALSAALGRRGLLAPLFDWTGIQFAFAFPGVVVAQTFVALPFVVAAVDAALRQIDSEVLDSARGVGLKPWEVLTKVTLPTLAPAIASGAGLAFARALGEFGTTLTFAGSQPGVTRTMPLGIYLEREVDFEAAYGLSALLIGLAVICLIIAVLPSLFARKPAPQARSIGTMDTAKLVELCTPQDKVDLHVVVDGQDITFPSGTVTALVGANGSGKTTLCKRIAGRLTGASLKPENATITLLTQKPGLPPRATAGQALTMVTRDKERTKELFAAAGLQELIDVPVPSLSGGQAAQVALLRVLAARPSILLLDEPFAALDIAAAARWRNVFQASHHTRTTVLVTHNPLDIRGLSSRMLVLEKGRVVTEGKTLKLLDFPPTAFVADLSGKDRLYGQLEAGEHATVFTFDNNRIALAEQLPRDVHGQSAMLVFDPEAIEVDTFSTELATPELGQPPSHKAKLQGTVLGAEAVGPQTMYLRIEVGGCALRVPATVEQALQFSGGEPVTCLLDTQNLTCHLLED